MAFGGEGHGRRSLMQKRRRKRSREAAEGRECAEGGPGAIAGVIECDGRYASVLTGRPRAMAKAIEYNGRQ
jgi:hypothetical protein